MESNELIAYAVTDTAIATLAERFLPLKIKGVEDKEGFAAVHEARMTVRNYRVDVEKKRKELKADALEYGKKVDAEAKRITALLAPIEGHLEVEENAYNEAREAIKNAARLKAEAEAKAKAEAEAAELKAKQEAEAARLKAEAEKLAAERKTMEAERRKLEEAQAEIRRRDEALAAERQRLANIEAARQREIERQRIAKEAAEKARIETEARLKREAEEAATREKVAAEAAESARVRAEQLRPDREKLLIVAACVAGINVPMVFSTDAQITAIKVANALDKATREIKGIINHYLPEVQPSAGAAGAAGGVDAELAELIG